MRLSSLNTRRQMTSIPGRGLERPGDHLGVISALCNNKPSIMQTFPNGSRPCVEACSKREKAILLQE